MKRFLILLACLAAPLLAQTPAAQAYRERLAAEVAAETATVYTIIFDNSGSMKGTKLAQAKEAFATWLAGVQPGNVWSVYKFVEGGGACALPFTPDGHTQAAALIQSLNADASTPIVATLKLAAEAIAKRRATRPYESHVVLVFTDGSENVDKRGNKGVIETLLDLRKTGLEIVGIGYAGQGDYMRGNASRYYDASDGASLRQGLAEVETEIDPLAPVKITEEEMRLLKNAQVAPDAPSTSPPRPAAPGKASAPASSTPTAPPAEPKTKSNNLFVFVAIAIFGIFCLRKAFSR